MIMMKRNSASWLVAAVTITALAPDASSAQTAPDGRSCHAVTGNPRLGGVVLFGGARVCGRDVLADSTLWVLQGPLWARIDIPFNGTREDVLLGFDSRRGTLLLYGGRNGPTVHRDTWEFDGRQWRSLTMTGPGPIEHAAAAYDSVRGRWVLFGGGSRSGAWPRETWEWDGTRWSANSAIGPVARVGHSMAAASNGGVYLYGGFNESGSLTDFWRWNGEQWSRIDSAGPAHTEGPALFALRGDTIALVAAQARGEPNAGNYRVWRWAENRWAPWGNAGPPGRIGQGIAYDPLRRRIVLYGGAAQGAQTSLSDVWEFDGTSWHRIR